MLNADLEAVLRVRSLLRCKVDRIQAALHLLDEFITEHEGELANQPTEDPEEHLDL